MSASANLWQDNGDSASRLAYVERMLVITASFLFWCLLIAMIERLILPKLGKNAMGNGPAAVIWHINRLYVHWFHRLKVSGSSVIPNEVEPGKIVVISNHQSPVDPLLIQSQCKFKIRWLMASEYMIPQFSFIWKLSETIPVDRDGQDSTALRKALRHLGQDGVIGLFPEGGIGDVREGVKPFVEGAAAMIAKTKARVLLAIVDGTPLQEGITEALCERSYSKVHFVDCFSFPDSMNVEQITSVLRTRIAEETGWPLVD